MRALPRKVSESSGLPGYRALAVVLNQLIDAVRDREIRESPNVRVEGTANGTTVHVKKSRGAGTVDDTWY